jgi:hypothetical protein
LLWGQGALFFANSDQSALLDVFWRLRTALFAALRSHDFRGMFR